MSNTVVNSLIVSQVFSIQKLAQSLWFRRSRKAKMILTMVRICSGCMLLFSEYVTLQSEASESEFSSIFYGYYIHV